MRSPGFLALLVVALAVCACSGRPNADRVVTSLPRAMPSDAMSSPSKVPTDAGLSAVLVKAMDGLDKSTYSSVSVAEAEGRVLLTGAVVRPDDRRHLERIVGGLPGVVSVADAVLLVDPPLLLLYQPDSAKEREIAQRFALSGVALRVVNGVVYLVGQADAQAEVDALRDGLADDTGIKWVDASAVVYASKM